MSTVYHSLSSIAHPQATYYHDTAQGELIIYDLDDYQKFFTNLEQGSVSLSLEGWVHVEKAVRSGIIASILCTC